jgi:hypothetical protein
MKNIRVVAAALATWLLVGWHVPSARGYAPVAAAAATLTDLKDVDELRALFNDDAGKVRLVLLLSPT